MKKRNVILIIIFFSLILAFLFFKYFKKEKIVEIELQNTNDVTYNSNIIEDVYYSSKDRKGNEYIIKAIRGEIDYKQKDIIYLTDVIINYLDNKITGEYLDSSIERNSMIISRNVFYTNLENILKADVIEMNIDTKDTRIFMYKNKEKVNIKSKQ